MYCSLIRLQKPKKPSRPQTHFFFLAGRLSLATFCLSPVAFPTGRWRARKSGCTALGRPAAHPASPATKSFLFPSSSELSSLHVRIGIIHSSGMGNLVRRRPLTGCVRWRMKNVWTRSITLLLSLNEPTRVSIMVISSCQR